MPRAGFRSVCRHLHGDCSRDHRRPVGAGVHRALHSRNGPRMAPRPRALRASSPGGIHSRRAAWLWVDLPRVLGRPCPRIRRPSPLSCSRGRSSPRITWTLVRRRGKRSSPYPRGVRQRRARSFFCWRSFLPFLSFRTRISARRTPRGIDSIEPISPPISSGTPH